jgi:aryl-phospho-beta-D-glucosidase BglC (GH1 family)
MENINRREFIKKASMGGAAMIASSGYVKSDMTLKKDNVNKLPRWRGFNFLHFYRPAQIVFDSKKFEVLEQDFKWIADWGFDFVRLPVSYPCYLKYDVSLGKDITPEETVAFREEALQEIDRVVFTANKYGLHVSLNLHRAPGFCINAGFREPFNLWKDRIAQEAFYKHWDMWAKRYRNISAGLLSFDLVNEPCYKEDMNDQYSPSVPIPGDVYRKVACGCLDVIHRQTPDRLVVADGNNGGSQVIPELLDLPVAQSCRGYYPHYVSHYRAGWVWKNPDDAPMPVWPCTINGEVFNRSTLEKFYKPWDDLVKQGIGVHCGECGCYRETPHNVFLAWFNDQLDILTSKGIGWGLWNLRGDFGLINSGREDVGYENWYGQKLDRKLLTLLQKY